MFTLTHSRLDASSGTLPCRTSGTDYWQSDDTADQLEAMRLCHTCPIEQECRTLSVGEIYGVWGGVVRGGSRAKNQQPREGKDVRCADAKCRQWFIAYDVRTRFCSATCRQRHRRATEKAERAAKRNAKVWTCEYGPCTEQFPRTQQSRRKYCGDKCKARAKAARERLAAAMGPDAPSSYARAS